MAHKNQMASTPLSAAPSLLDTIFPWVLPVLLFFSITGTSRFAAALLGAVFLVFSIGRLPPRRLRERLSPLTLAVFLYALVCLCSGLWSHFGSYAVRESAKTLAAFSIFGILLVRARREKLRGLLQALNAVLAVIALLCIDASSLQLLSRGFSWVMGLFKAGYPMDSIGYETGVRITGIFSNANVSAGLLAFGLLISLYLLRSAAEEREKLGVCVALGVQALAFFLSFSMGAMAAFAVTCLVYVLCSAKGTRLSLFLLMLECVVATVLCAFAATPFLGGGGAGVVPVLAAIVCGLLIWALDRFVGRRLLARLDGHDKAVAIFTAALVALAAVYVLLAYSLTGGITLSGTLSRAVYPDAGSYTVSFEGIDASVVIYSQTEPELMMHTNTPLYEGSLSGASFTVPEGSRVVWFELAGDGDLSSLTLSDGTVLPLGYKLLPDFAANRLQGLWANQNFIQRLVFFRDGMKLFSASPLIGWGAGGVEGQLTGVQSFYYESKYIHNQFIQIMDEAGVLGLAAFAFLLGSALWMLVRRRKTDADPVLAMLAACLTMMIAHSLTEVVWSTQVYQSAVFVLFAVLILHCAEPKAESIPSPARGWTAMAAMWCVAAVFTGLLSGHLLAARQMRNLDTGNITPTEFMSAMQTMDRLDVYDDSDYKVNLMGNALQTGTAIGQGLASRCARELLATQEYDACYNTAAYYYLPLRDLPNFFDAVQTGLRQERSNPDAWNSAFHLFKSTFEQLEAADMEDFVSGVLSTGEQLDAANADMMAPIVLDDGNQALLDCARSLGSATGEAARTVLAAALS
ncbi:O-antigen ligase [Oscillibacter sp.]|uniref:O-antigen ligase family protein n=1 Tax=Oscillibacter sp. TaxID=1945593 RepID=UPI00262528FD|nr:O-antigen ligase family protein [Oscillibacter sp.]MDD3346572.1 O-antigen ligase family protein [Oscillibacter sp.]